jgi:hypothetical protein
VRGGFKRAAQFERANAVHTAREYTRRCAHPVVATAGCFRFERKRQAARAATRRAAIVVEAAGANNVLLFFPRLVIAFRPSVHFTAGLSERLK